MIVRGLIETHFSLQLLSGLSSSYSARSFLVPGKYWRRRRKGISIPALYNFEPDISNGKEIF